MTRKRFYLCLLLAVALGTGLDLAQRSESPTYLTIDQALALAKQCSPEIQAARAALEAANGKKLQARALPEPELVVELGEMPSPLAAGKAEERRIGIQQTIDWPGRMTLDLRLAGAFLDCAQADLERTELELSARVRRACLQLLYLEKRDESLRGLASLLDRFSEMAASRYRVGVATYSDVLRSRLERTSAANDLDETQGRLQAARSRLRRFLGEEAGLDIHILDSGEPSPLANPLEEMLPPKLARHPATLRCDLELEAGRLGLRRAQLSSAPSLSLGLFQQRLHGEAPYDANAFAGSTVNAWAVEAGLSLPMLWGSRGRGARMEAAGRLAAAEARSRAVKASLVEAVTVAYAEVKRGEARVSRLRSSLLRDADEAQANGLSLYAAGKLDFTSLLDLIRTRHRAELDLLAAELQLRLAWVRLDTPIASEIPLEENHDEEQ